MRLYGLVSVQTQKAVELYPTRDAAESALAEVRADDPEPATVLRVEPVALGQESPN